MEAKACFTIVKCCKCCQSAAQKGPPLNDGKTVEERALRCARRREGGARPEARAAQGILISACGGDQLRFLKRQLSLPVSMISQ